MRNTKFIAVIFCLVFFLISIQASAFDIFVWENHNNLDRTDPVFDERMTASQSIMRTLTNLEHEFDNGTDLPGNLNDYDVIVVVLGFPNNGD